MSRPRKRDKDLPACVYRKHGAFWYVKNGRWTRLGDNLVRALEAYARLVTVPSSGGMVALIDAAMIEMRRSIKPTTAKQYEVAARKLKTMLVEFEPHQVTSRHVAQIKVRLAASPNMANRCMSVLRQVFAYALENQLVNSNPVIGVARYEERKRDRYLTDAEFAAIYAQALPRLQVIMDLCYLTGQRISDVLAIRQSDLTDAGISFRQGKTDEKLTVRWTPELRAVVERAKGLRGNIVAMTLLHNRRGKRPDYSTVKIQWSAACAKAGVVDAHLHDLRAKSLTDAKRQGKDATALAGHRSASMTARYIRLRESPEVEGPSFRQPIDSSGKAV